MFTQLIPAGNKVVFKVAENWKERLESGLKSYNFIFTSSGTAALVYALNVVKKKRPDRNEVIVPAYTCPDVLSAIFAANLKPVLVDLDKDSTRYEPGMLHKAIGPGTLAIIGIDLFGIPEDYQLLKKLKAEYGFYVVRDSAQYFPEDMNYFLGSCDVVVLTFGRGKPISMLETGLVLFDKSIQHINNNQLNRLSRFINFKYFLKAFMYNILVSRKVYWWVEKIPMLNIGKTEYHDFSGDIVTFSASIKLIPANIDMYFETDNSVQSFLIDMISSFESNLIRLPFDKLLLEKNAKLNRLPLVVKDKQLREHLYQKLRKQGLGVSKMYPHSLPNISHVPEEITNKSYESAEIFANEILTLPVHQMVNRQDATRMIEVIRECVQSRLAALK